MNVIKLGEQWQEVALAMAQVADTFRPDKTPIDTSYALDNLGTELKVLANTIRENY